MHKLHQAKISNLGCKIEISIEVQSKLKRGSHLLNSIDNILLMHKNFIRNVCLFKSFCKSSKNIDDVYNNSHRWLQTPAIYHRNNFCHWA